MSSDEKVDHEVSRGTGGGGKSGTRTIREQTKGGGGMASKRKTQRDDFRGTRVLL